MFRTQVFGGAVVLALAIPSVAFAQAADSNKARADSAATTAARDTAIGVTFGGWIDTYYAYGCGTAAPIALAHGIPLLAHKDAVFPSHTPGGFTQTDPLVVTLLGVTW